MYSPLTIEEQVDKTVQQDMVTFRENIQECLGAKLTCAELEEVGIPDTLGYVLFAGEDQNKMTFPDPDEEITPEVCDGYAHAYVMLPRESQMMHGTVKSPKWDLDGNPLSWNC